MLNEALRLIRVYHDISQKVAAARLQISAPYLSEIETRGRKSQRWRFCASIVRNSISRCHPSYFSPSIWKTVGPAATLRRPYRARCYRSSSSSPRVLAAMPPNGKKSAIRSTNQNSIAFRLTRETGRAVRPDQEESGRRAGDGAALHQPANGAAPERQDQVAHHSGAARRSEADPFLCQQSLVAHRAARVPLLPCEAPLLHLECQTPHAGISKEVRKLDVREYFPSTPSHRVYWFFHTVMRCSTDVAAVLAKLLTVEGHLATGSTVRSRFCHSMHSMTCGAPSRSSRKMRGAF